MEDAEIYDHSICDNSAEEDYIELEVIGSSNSTISLLHFKKISALPPQQTKEFEFQMFPFTESKIISSSADELFYNGKLLPLDHLPLHNNPLSNKFLHVSKCFDDFEQSFSTPLSQSYHVSRKLNQEDYSTDDERSKFLHVSKSLDDFEQSFSTPLSQSCHVNGEVSNQEDYFFGNSTDDESSKWSKGSLTRKLRLIKQISFDHSKLKSSKGYIKCLINNSVNKLVAKKELFGKIHHRKSSFSGAIKKLLTTKSSSGNIQEMHLLMRNRDMYYSEADHENSIQAAIAHCKNSREGEPQFSPFNL